MKYRLSLFAIIFGVLLAGIIYSCSQQDRGSGEYASTSPKAFVGAQTCASCHETEMKAWEGSHHERAMDVADSSSVRGNFNNVTFSHKGETFRFFRKDSLYMVEAPGPDGKQHTYQITHTFGWTPLQQYLVDYGKGKLQALNVAWDTQEEKWFSLYPDEKLKPGDWRHWTGSAMNWNTMCADCHSTQLRQNYIASADSFHTTWTNINVSCESCHGPGKQHVEFMQTQEGQQASIKRIRKDLKLTWSTLQKGQIDECARCHSLREKLVDKYDHDKSYLDHFNPNLPHPDMYFADGQIKGEDYVYASFLQSKMFQKQVMCSNCHEPHSLELRANITDNSLCMQCHLPSYNTREHTFHEPNTEASQCVSCHMPGRYYMVNDFRRDHSFRAPRPDLSAKFGTPNACNSCHDDKSAQWAADAVRKWYGPQRADHFSETLVRADKLGIDSTRQELHTLVQDSTQPAIARATALWYLGQQMNQQSVPIVEAALDDPEPLVRKSAARTMAGLPGQIKRRPLAKLLDDSLAVVRRAAIAGLAEFNKDDFSGPVKSDFSRELDAYRQQLYINQYFPEGEMNRGQFFEKRGQPQKAIQAYRKAIQKNPNFNPARINLAYLLNSRGQNDEAKKLLITVTEQEPDFGPAHYSLALLLAEQKKLEQSLSQFEQAARLMPDNGRVFYNWAIALQTLKRMDRAEEVYLKAIHIEPDNATYRYGISTLYIQQKQYQKALKHARKLVELQPQNRRFRQLLAMIQQNL